MHARYLKIFSSAVIVAALTPQLAYAQTTPPARPAQDAPPAKPSGDQSGEVVVRGTRSDVMAAPDRVSYNVSNDLQTQTGTIADALRNVPGVAVDLQGNVSLRGDTGVTILIDGRPSAMMRGDSRGDFLLSMPAGQVERVEVITNPSAAMSPEGSGGVINLVTRRTRQGASSITARATIGTSGTGISGGASLSGARQNGPLTLSGDIGYRRFAANSGASQQRSQLDSLSGNFFDSTQESTLDFAGQGRNARIAADYDFDKKNRLSTELSYRANENRMERGDIFTSPVAGASFSRDSEIGIENRVLSGRTSWRHTLGKDHELVIDLEVDSMTFQRTLEAGITPSGAPQRFERITNAAERDDTGFKVDYKRPMGGGSSLNLGYEVDYSRNDFFFTGARGPSWTALTPVPNLTNSFEYDQTVHAWYATYQAAFGGIEFQPGLRLEQVDISLAQSVGGPRVTNGYFRAYPTLHLGTELSATQKLRGSYSRRIQRPGAQDLNPNTLYIDPLNLRRGNPNLVPEVTDSFELAWQLRKGPAFYSVTAFYRASDGGVTDLVSDIGGGAFLITRVNLATATRTGLEFVANGRITKTLTYNGSATLMWVEIDPRLSGLSTPRSGTTAMVRVNMNWQPTPKDFFQLNANWAGNQLLPQGYRGPSGVLNLGYRRKINDRFSLLLTAQNVLDTTRQETVIETAAFRDRVLQRGPGRAFMLGLTYTAGGQVGRRRPEQTFDFDQGGAPAQ